MKKTFMIMIAAMLLLLSRTWVYAENNTTKAGSCEFNGNEMVSSFDSTQVAVSVSEMEPGDSVTFSVDILNSSDITTDWYMSNAVIQSLEEAQSVAENGGYTYILTYTDSAGTVKTIYSSDNIGGEKETDAGVGLNEATNSLEDFFYLVKLAPGEGGTVDLYVGLDGESQGNIYQDTLASLMMNFAVETPVSTYTTKTPWVKTGDKFMIGSVLVFIIGFVLLLCGLVKGKKRRVKTLSVLLFVTGLLLCSARTDVKAAGYTYTVTISCGNQGEFSNAGAIQVKKAEGNHSAVAVENFGQKLKITGLEYGDTLSFRAQSAVSLSDNSKYYVKGIRLSGRDNNTVAKSAFTVVEDQDYVVAYGIPGDLTEYTIRYLDESGNQLADSQTYFGNVGDEPVIAYLYIEGYIPASYNISKVLSADATENVFDFIYTQGSLNAAANTEEANAAGTTAAGTDGTNATLIVDDNVPLDGNDMTPDAEANDGEQIIEDEETPTSSNPFKNIVDEAVPMAQNAVEQGLLFPFMIGLVAFVGVILAIIFVVKKRQ